MAEQIADVFTVCNGMALSKFIALCLEHECSAFTVMFNTDALNGFVGLEFHGRLLSSCLSSVHGGSRGRL
jgi:hypothetical protein